MAVLSAYVRLIGFAMVASIVLILVPTDAAAHTLPNNDPPMEFALDDGSDGDAHCHGAIECVVTLFLENSLDGKSNTKPTAEFVAFTADSLVSVSLGRDPPIPILFG